MCSNKVIDAFSEFELKQGSGFCKLKFVRALKDISIYFWIRSGKKLNV